MTTDTFTKAYDDERVLAREVEALRLLAGPVVRIVEQSQRRLVLERVLPGHDLTGLAERDDAAATCVVADLLRGMWVPAPASYALPTVVKDCAALDRVESLPTELLEVARLARDGLLATAPAPAVLHGDLHHGNVLWSDTSGWTVIDPHGVVGDPGYDVGPLLLNPRGRDVAALAQRRLGLLSERLGLDRDRLRRWSLVRAVLSCAWDVEEGQPPHPGSVALAAALLPGVR